MATTNANRVYSSTTQTRMAAVPPTEAPDDLTPAQGLAAWKMLTAMADKGMAITNATLESIESKVRGTK